MKKSELKEMLKPIVQECMQEAILESGLIAQVVTEVMKGALPVLKEVKAQQIQKEVAEVTEVPSSREFVKSEAPETISEMKKNRKSDLREIAGNGYRGLDFKIGGVDIFEGTKPVRPQLNDQARAAGGALADSDPGDPGISLAAFGIKGKLKQI